MRMKWLFAGKAARCGFTLVEILAVLLLLGVLGAVVARRYLDMTDLAREKAVAAAVAELNGREKTAWAREMLRSAEVPDDVAIFADVADAGLGSDFSWAGAPAREGSSQLDFRGETYGLRRTASSAIAAGVWQLFSGIFHDFGAIAPSEFIQQPAGTWAADPAEGFSTGQWGSRIYAPNPLGNGPYEVAVVASLGASRADVANPDGGYGVFFDAVLNDAGEIQSGYILQFDRGYGSGEIIIREWVDGREVSIPVLRINDRSIIPIDVDDPDWWTQQHALSLRVTEVDGAPDQRQVSVVLDGAVLDSSFAFSPVGGDTYTGLRSWGSFENPSEFQSMEIR
jgi:prepilin-type N-terminal cleavage/methylation domain-containing protein